MKAFSPILGLAFLILFPLPAGSSPPIEWRTHEETIGQEYQHGGAAAVHQDGSWTAAWIDFRTGYGSIFMRSFTSQDEPLGPVSTVTDGFGLFRFDVNAEQIAEPFLASLGDGRSLLAWIDPRHGHPDIQLALVDTSGVIAGPVTVNEEGPYATRRGLRIALSGDRALVVWTEGDPPLRKAIGQVLTTSLQPVLGNFPLDPGGEDIQSDPRPVASPGGWVVAWSGDSQDPAQIYLRAYDRDGLPLFAPKLAESDPLAIQIEPSIVAVTGGYFVTWTSGYAGRVSLLGRLVDLNLDPAASSTVVSSADETVTPRMPEILPLDDGSLLEVWKAGPAQTTRFHARRVLLPGTASGSIVVIDDPVPPQGQIITPDGLTLLRGSTSPARILWSDGREGWDLLYHLSIDEEGHALGQPVPVDWKDGTSTQVFPDVVIFPDHRGAVVWEDFRSGSMGIYATYLDELGAPQGGSFRVSDMTGGSSSAPANSLRDLLRSRPTLGATTGGFLVAAWSPFLGGGSRVVYQIFDPAGTPIGGNTLLPSACGGGVQGQPVIAATRDGGFYLVWWDTCLSGDGDVYAQHFLADGSATTDTIRVADPAYGTATQISPAVASGEGGETVITWLDNRMGNFDVYAQRLGPTGTKIGSNVPISIPEEGGSVVQSNPDVASQADRYVVVWDEEPFTSGGVVGLLVVLPSAKNGLREDQQTSFDLASGWPGMRYPRVAMAPDGRFVVTYWDISSDSARVMAQRYDPQARPIGEPYSVNSLGGSVASLQGNVAADGWRIRYAFADNRDQRSWDVRVKTVSWPYAGDLTPVAISTWAISEDSGALELSWSVPEDRGGSAYRVWRETEEGAYGPQRPGPAALIVSPDPISPLVPGGTDYRFRDPSAAPGVPYAYWIQDLGGEFIGPWRATRSGTALAFELRAIDNPFSREARLSWSLPRSGECDLAVFDLSGRLVRTILPSRRRTAGAGEERWDGRDDAGRDLPAGIYWARLRFAPAGERSVKLLRLR